MGVAHSGGLCTLGIIAFKAEVVGMSVGSGFPVLSSQGLLVK